MKNDWNPIAERYDPASGLWLTEHVAHDGHHFVIARPRQDVVFACAAGPTVSEAIANWKRRVASTYQQRIAA